MKKAILRNIISVVLLLILPTGLIAGEKFVKAGAGYKAFTEPTHKVYHHSGRYFYSGYGVTFGEKLLQTLQFQLSNSNRQVEYDLPYVSASTAVDVSHEFNFNIANFKNSKHYIGPYVGNSFSLNFFPKVDNQNFVWQNFASVGISTRNRFKLNGLYQVDFNAQVPLYSVMALNRFDRFSGENPTNTPMITDKAFVNRIFKPFTELGLITEKWGLSFGAYYQTELNYYSRLQGSDVFTFAHSLSLRLIY